jgi:hypothetical protein
MNRVATRMVWSMCCFWALSGCATADDAGIEPPEDIVAEVASGDGSDSAEVTAGDAEVSEVLVTADGLADGQASDDTATLEDMVFVQDTAPSEDTALSEDTAPSEDTAVVEDSSPDFCWEPNPAGCTQTLCEDDEVCDPSQGCNPSSCFCDEASGEWDCSKDCGGGTCVPKQIEETACPGANPAGCADTGCPDGYSCASDPQICVPSTCSCDDEAGTWICSEDCGGGVCKKDEESPCAEPDPTSCSVIGCQEGFFCDLEAEGCGASSCMCDAGSGAWICTKDCLPGQCIPIKEPQGCLKPDPTSCSIIGCHEGFFCDLEEEGCGASSCMCDAGSGAWICTNDCLPGQCVPAVADLCSEEELKTPDGCMTCDEVLVFVTAEAQNNAQNSAADCEVDTDCVMAQALSDCLGLCPIAVKSMWAVKYVNKVKLVSDAYCQGYQDKCPYATPACVPSEPVCVGGVCQAEPTP